jgi:NAD-dependent deacetylase
MSDAAPGFDIPFDIPKEALERLRVARRVFALTGAGVSAESGIPTFRAPRTGLWSQYRIEDFATPGAWRRDRRLVWSWYSHRRRLARHTQPNPAHLALARLEHRSARFLLATQNVDGLHQRAGSAAVVELHGSLFRFRCSAEDTPIAWEDPDDDDPEALARLERGELMEPPPCPRCGAALRPDIVWFEEALPRAPWAAAEDAATACDVCLVIGTSALVFPTANLPRLAQRHGAYLIEVNPEATSMTRQANWSAHAQAGMALPALLRALEESASA